MLDDAFDVAGLLNNSMLKTQKLALKNSHATLKF
jgi:hypothetical protein